MLNSKLCAIALIDRLRKSSNIIKLLKKSNKLIVEEQYNKSDIIFYKFKNSNIAVSKKLNHLDFSILSDKDWEFLLVAINGETPFKDEYIEKTVIECTALINEWSEENSIISKMYRFMNNQSLNQANVAQSIKTLNSNKKILDLLLHNKATLCDNKYYYNNDDDERYEDVTIDVNGFGYGKVRSVDVGEDMIEFKGDFNIKSWSSAIDRIASIEKPDNLITSIKSCGLDIQENTRLIEEKYSKL
jgi:hypothetical protein